MRLDGIRRDAMNGNKTKLLYFALQFVQSTGESLTEIHAITSMIP